MKTAIKRIDSNAKFFLFKDTKYLQQTAIVEIEFRNNKSCYFSLVNYTTYGVLDISIVQASQLLNKINIFCVKTYFIITFLAYMYFNLFII